MRLSIHILAVLLISSSAVAATPPPSTAFVPGEVLVKIQENTSANAMTNIELIADVDNEQLVSALPSGTILRFHSRSLSTEALTATLQQNPNVVYAEPNYIVHALDTPNDPSYSLLWALRNTGQTVLGIPGAAGADISAEAAWGITKGSAAIVVGVVDTGVDYTHPDLAANIWSNPGGKGNAACAAGTHGFNAITLTCDPRDDHYHGTHVSGTIGASGNNALGVAGVNWTTSIMGLKFLNANGSGTTAGAIAAIDFAVQAKLDGVNVRILSNSWGGGGFSKALLDEINKASDNDILFVAAAGNDSVSNDTSPHYPANYNTANMISVAATDNLDALAYFSDFGLSTVHLGAPGYNILSCYPGGSYQYLSGTSMATPHVSGVAALVLAKTPGLTTAQVKSAILANTDPIPSLAGKTITGGRLNAARALGVAPGPSFTISASPGARNVVQGASTAYVVTVTPSGGFTGSVDFSVTGLPTGASGTFTPPSTTSTTTLSVTTTGTTALYSNNLVITGVSGAISRSATVSLTVLPKPILTACPSFSTSQSYSISGSPTALAAGDLNRDGYPDLVVADTSSNAISILLGAGNGTFYYGPNYGVGGAPLSIAVGDFNRDGKADLAVANANSNNVSVLLGNGDGTFQGAINYNAGTNPFWVAVGDFNADGKADLAVANDGSGNVSILLGNGDGTFQPAANFSAGSGPYALSVGDFNGDGRADLVVASYNANNISVLLGNGDGTFQGAVTYGVAIGPSSVAVGDFNGDGKPDLAVSNSVSNNVSILTGNGDGTFQPAVNYAVGSAPNTVAVLDVDNDGKMDLAVVNSNSSNVSLLPGKGDGTFLGAINYITDLGPYQVAVGDFNADGRTDLAVVAAGYYYSDVSILLNNGACSFNCDTLTAPVNYAVGSSPHSMTAVDVNGDGRPDLVVANSTANNVSIVLGNADGTFVPTSTWSTGGSPRSVDSGDFNGDGKRDLAVANSSSGDVSILLGNGDGTFQPAVSYGSGSNPHSVAVADFNRDGKPDLVVANSGSGNVSILLNAGSGVFLPAVAYATDSGPESVAIGDFNRDGKLDLAVANSGAGTLSVLLGNGDGTFQPATGLTVGTSPSFVMARDFNHDGKVDLAVANSGSNNVSILLGNGNGTFQTAVNYGVGTGPLCLTAGDLNDDGVADLAVANSGSNDVSILLGNGDGSFVLAGGSGAGTGPHSIIARDFNHDGKPDLAVLNNVSGNVSILLNTCPVPDLTITKTHSGSFVQGDTARVYTITVTNVGAGPTNAVVTVTDALPTGLTATAMTGTGWTCNRSTLTCTRTDALAAGASYLPIALTVSVANSAPPSVINSASVFGGGELNVLNDSVSDPTTVAPVTDLTVIGSHSGDFTQGATGRTYRLAVRNPGGSPTTGVVSVTDSLPSGLTVTAMSGTGWTCNPGALTCTRGDALAGGASYPVITLTVNVAPSAPSSVTNVVTVSGGGEVNTANDTSSDFTTIWSSQTCGSFGPPVNISNSYYTNAIVSGDFNGDGKVDLAVTNSNNNTVSILLGDGAGGFAAPVAYPVGSNPNSIVIADVNNDGKPDLAVVNLYSYTLSILLGNGDGTFAVAVNYTVGNFPAALAVGDFNGDGNIDFAVANQSGNLTAGDVSILLGNGDGTLRPVVGLTAGGYGAVSLVTADFDGDGKLDLGVTSNSYSQVFILRGNGDGTFQTAVGVGATGSGFTLAAGDFNGDGKPDLATGTYYSGYIAILLGNGDGTFQTAVNYYVSYGSSAMAIDDVNGDGKADIVTASNSSNNVSVLLGNGDGTFQTPANYYVSGGPTRVVIADFNRDGKADLAVTEYYNSGIGVMLGGCPDLTIAISHNGNFIGGQGAYYSLTVSNSGGGSSQGSVTVTDVLPDGLTATAMYGSGWNCDAPSLTCTTSYTLTGGASYSPIQLLVNVSKFAPALVTDTATVAGGSDTNLTNNGASDPTTIAQAADLTVTLAHNGTFAANQIGRTYTITVQNAGGAPTSGTVVATDPSSYGLLITGMAGTGWTCNLGTFSCSRSDPLAVSGAYPPITVTVNVAYNAPSSVANIAYVSGGGEVFTGNDGAYDYTSIVGTPVNVLATSISTSQVGLTWDAVTYATSYQVLRSANHGPFNVVGLPSANVYVDVSLSPNTTYLYRVQAAATGAVGPMSAVDLATTMLFTDDPLVAGSTVIRAVHVTELRTAVNLVRAAAGLPPATFSDPSLTAGYQIKAVHLAELRSFLDAARAAIGVPAMVYTDSALAAGTTIKAAHIRDLRAGVK